jgi:hypothetical protein
MYPKVEVNLSWVFLPNCHDHNHDQTSEKMSIAHERSAGEHERLMSKEKRSGV